MRIRGICLVSLIVLVSGCAGKRSSESVTEVVPPTPARLLTEVQQGKIPLPANPLLLVRIDAKEAFENDPCRELFSLEIGMPCVPDHEQKRHGQEFTAHNDAVQSAEGVVRKFNSMVGYRYRAHTPQIKFERQERQDLEFDYTAGVRSIVEYPRQSGRVHLDRFGRTGPETPLDGFGEDGMVWIAPTSLRIESEVDAYRRFMVPIDPSPDFRMHMRYLFEAENPRLAAHSLRVWCKGDAVCKSVALIDFSEDWVVVDAFIGESEDPIRADERTALASIDRFEPGRKTPATDLFWSSEAPINFFIRAEEMWQYRIIKGRAFSGLPAGRTEQFLFGRLNFDESVFDVEDLAIAIRARDDRSFEVQWVATPTKGRIERTYSLPNIELDAAIGHLEWSYRPRRFGDSLGTVLARVDRRASIRTQWSQILELSLLYERGLQQQVEQLLLTQSSRNFGKFSGGLVNPIIGIDALRAKMARSSDGALQIAVAARAPAKWRLDVLSEVIAAWLDGPNRPATADVEHVDGDHVIRLTAGVGEEVFGKERDVAPLVFQWAPDETLNLLERLPGGHPTARYAIEKKWETIERLVMRGELSIEVDSNRWVDRGVFRVGPGDSPDDIPVIRADLQSTPDGLSECGRYIYARLSLNHSSSYVIDPTGQIDNYSESCSDADLGPIFGRFRYVTALRVVTEEQHHSRARLLAKQACEFGEPAACAFVDSAPEPPPPNLPTPQKQANQFSLSPYKLDLFLSYEPAIVRHGVGPEIDLYPVVGKNVFEMSQLSVLFDGAMPMWLVRDWLVAVIAGEAFQTRMSAQEVANLGVKRMPVVNLIAAQSEAHRIPHRFAIRLPDRDVTQKPNVVRIRSVANNRAAPPELAVDFTEQGLNLEFDGEPIEAVDGCPRSGPTLCVDDFETLEKASADAFAGLLSQESAEATTELERVLKVYDFDRLKPRLQPFAERLGDQKYFVVIHLRDTKLPFILLAELLARMRVELPRPSSWILELE